MSIVIVGAGNFAREVKGWMAVANVGIKHMIADGTPGLLSITDYQPVRGEELLVAISDCKGREKVVTSLVERKAVFHNMRLGLLSPTAQVGIGTIMCPTSLASAGAQIGDFCIINVLSSIGHDVKMGAFCTVSAHVDLMGHVEVGQRVLFGSGARVLPGVKIGDDAVIGAGALIVNDVPAGTTMYAAPARSL